MPEDVLRVRTKRSGQKAQHVFAAAILIFMAVDHLSRGGARHDVLLPLCELAAGLLLILTVIRERITGGHQGGVAWVEVAGAVMALVEAVERTQGRHHLSFVILSFAAPALLFVFAIFDAQITAHRYVKVDDEAFEVRLRLLFRRRIALSEVAGFRIRGSSIEFDRRKGGKRSVSLRDIVNGDAALAWSADQLRLREIPELPPQ